MRGDSSGAALVSATPEARWAVPDMARHLAFGLAALVVFVALCAAHIAMDRGLIGAVAAVPIGFRAFAGAVALAVGAMLLTTYTARRDVYSGVVGLALLSSGVLMTIRVGIALVGLQAGPGSPAAAYLFDTSIRMGWAQNLLFPTLLLLGLTTLAGGDERWKLRRYFFVPGLVLALTAFVGGWLPGFPGGIVMGEVVGRPAAAWSVSAHILVLMGLWRSSELSHGSRGTWLRFAVLVSLLNQAMVLPFWLPQYAAASSALGSVMNLVVYGLVAVGSLLGIHASTRNEAEAMRRAEAERDERHRVEAALARQAARLQQANEELAQYAYLASHDLQEPLRMVTNYLQLIERRYGHALDDDGREFMHFAVDGAVRMKRLTNDLLAYSRVSTRVLEPREVALDDAIAAANKNLEVAVEEAGAEITADPLPKVEGDPSQLVQLFQNLFANAVKFRREGVPPRVHVSAVREDGVYRISVADNGIGIDPKYHDKVFAVFQRLHRSDVYPGSGIGLAMCRKIVERHGGRIWFESRPDEGTTFHISLPAEARPHAAEAPEEDPDVERLVESLIERARELL